MEAAEFLDRKFASGKARHCWMCGCTLNRFTASVDHLQPRAHGGRNSADNYKLACKPCNSSRGSKDISRELRRELKGDFKPKARDFSALSEAIQRNAKNQVA